VYLSLLQEHSDKAELRILGFCLMTNHAHLVVVPEHEKAMAYAIGRTHYRYANYFQARMGRTGHLWQNRYFSCPMSDSHLVNTMIYVEQNPVRSKLVVNSFEWRWSSARFHVGRPNEFGFLREGWGKRYSGAAWAELLAAPRCREERRKLERCTFSGKPYGE
jgi:putative transposase